MPTRAARRDIDLIEVDQLVARQIEAAELGESFLGDQATAHGVLDRLRLLEDFLEHEMLEAALFDLIEIPVDPADALLDASRLEIENFISLASHYGQLAVVEVDDLASMGEN